MRDIFACVLICTFILGLNGYRFKRQSAIDLICRRNPHLSYCKSNTGDTTTTTATTTTPVTTTTPAVTTTITAATDDGNFCDDNKVKFTKSCYEPPPETLTLISFCIRYSRRCEVGSLAPSVTPVTSAATQALATVGTTTVSAQFCTQFRTQYSDVCLPRPTRSELVLFCFRYSQNCPTGVTPINPFVTIGPPPTGGGAVITGPSGITSNPESKQVINQLCQRFAPEAKKHCYGAQINPAALPKCKQYFRDCKDFIDTDSSDNVLRKISGAFSSKVGWETDQWGVRGIPFYPINSEGAIGGGKSGGVDFGTWGAAVNEKVGVRDFFEAGNQFGGNWYDGIYGGGSSWGVPILSQFGVHGSSSSGANVPINPDNLGDPLGFGSNFGIGNYFGAHDGTKVDWFGGGVGNQKGWSVPIIGLSGTSGSSVSFPSLGDFFNLGQLRGGYKGALGGSRRRRR